MKTYPSEYSECVALARYLRDLQNKGEVIVFSHTAQSTFTRSWGQRTRNKQMGVCPGLPDYIVVTKDKVLFIEMKKEKYSYPTTEQKKWIEALQGKSIEARVCRGFKEAEELIIKKLKEEL